MLLRQPWSIWGVGLLTILWSSLPFWLGHFLDIQVSLNRSEPRLYIYSMGLYLFLTGFFELACRAIELKIEPFGFIPDSRSLFRDRLRILFFIVSSFWLIRFKLFFFSVFWAFFGAFCLSVIVKLASVRQAIEAVRSQTSLSRLWKYLGAILLSWLAISSWGMPLFLLCLFCIVIGILLSKLGLFHKAAFAPRLELNLSQLWIYWTSTTISLLACSFWGLPVFFLSVYFVLQQELTIGQMTAFRGLYVVFLLSLFRPVLNKAIASR